jgi:hypothetical protein
MMSEVAKIFDTLETVDFAGPQCRLDSLSRLDDSRCSSLTLFIWHFPAADLGHPHPEAGQGECAPLPRMEYLSTSLPW